MDLHNIANDLMTNCLCLPFLTVFFCFFFFCLEEESRDPEGVGVAICGHVRYFPLAPGGPNHLCVPAPAFLCQLAGTMEVCKQQVQSLVVQLRSGSGIQCFHLRAYKQLVLWDV